MSACARQYREGWQTGLNATSNVQLQPVRQIKAPHGSDAEDCHHHGPQWRHPAESPASTRTSAANTYHTACCFVQLPEWVIKGCPVITAERTWSIVYAVHRPIRQHAR